MDDDSEFDELDGSEFDEQSLTEEESNRTKPKRSAEYEMIKSALETHLVEYSKKKQARKRNIDQLTGIIEEYLGSFVLLGYNYEGESITVVSANTQQHSDSLSTLLQKFMMNTTPGNDNMV